MRAWIIGAGLLLLAMALSGCDPVTAPRPAPGAIPEPGPAPRFPALAWAAHDGRVCLPTDQAFDVAGWAVDVAAHEERLRAWGRYWQALAGG
jgi:hypothetical protein